MSHEPVDLGADDLPHAAAVIGRAFADLPQTLWAAPDEPREVRAHLLSAQFVPHFLAAVNTGAGTAQGIWVDGDLVAASLWTTQTGDGTAPNPPDDESTGDHDDRFRTIDTTLARLEPATAHDHLHLLGVAPEHQRKGYGSVLLEHYLRVVERDGRTPLMHLAASTPEAAGLYRKFGFLDRAPVFLPDTEIAFYPMRRPPPAPR